jgi:hypothetical protein
MNDEEVSATPVPLTDFPICDICYKSWFDCFGGETFFRISDEDGLVVCQTCLTDEYPELAENI